MTWLLTCAPLKFAVGNSEDVRVWRLWVFVKCRFQTAKPATDVYLTLSTDSILISEDDKTMPAKCHPVGTSAVRQDDCPSELHHIQLLFSGRELPLLSVQKSDAGWYYRHLCHT